MRNRSLAMVVMATVALTLLTAAGIYAATAPDVMTMDAPYKHKKSLVNFTHKKHVDEHKITCGECHHDDQGKPLTDLKDGDPVKKCFDCHNTPGELKGKEAKGKSDKELRKYHANALHENCVDCHKKYNKEHDTKAAPQKCTECHPKEKK